MISAVNLILWLWILLQYSIDRYC